MKPVMLMGSGSVRLKSRTVDNNLRATLKGLSVSNCFNPNDLSAHPDFIIWTSPFLIPPNIPSIITFKSSALHQSFQLKEASDCCLLVSLMQEWVCLLRAAVAPPAACEEKRFLSDSRLCCRHAERRRRRTTGFSLWFPAWESDVSPHRTWV